MKNKKKSKKKKANKTQVYTCDKIIDRFGLPTSISTKDWENYYKAAGYPMISEWECLHSDGSKTALLTTSKGKFKIRITSQLTKETVETPEFDIEFIKEMCS